MDHIQPFEQSGDRQKACWFPFKNAYSRRRIKPGHDDTPQIYVLDGNNGAGSKSVEVSLTAYTEASSEDYFEDPGLAPQAQLILPPDLLTELDEATAHNSILSEEDDLFYGYGKTTKLAMVNPNCLSKGCWVDEMVEGGSLACAEDFIQAGKSINRIGRSFNSFGAISTKAGSSARDGLSDDISLSRVPTPTGQARIEVEYDFSKTNHSCDSVNEVETVQRGTCGAIQGRGKPLTDTNGRVRTEMSSASNSTMTRATDKRPLPSHASASTSSSSSSGDSSIMTTPLEVAQPVPAEAGQEFLSNRFFCGAMQPLPPVANKKRTKTTVVERTQPEDVEAEEKVQHKSVVPVKPIDPPESVIIAKHNDFQGLACTKNPALDSMWASTAKRGCAVPGLHPAHKSRPVPLDEDLPQGFFIEVEATQRQLQEVRDLDELQEEEYVLSSMAVDVSRTASLVDDDSAFQERDGFGDVLKKFATGKRRSWVKTRSQKLPEIAPLVTPPRGKTRVTVTALSKTKYHPTQVTPDRSIARSSVGDQSNIGSSGKLKDTSHLSSRTTSRISVVSSRVPTEGFQTNGFDNGQHGNMPNDQLLDIRSTSRDLSTQSLKRPVSRNGNGRRPVDVVEEIHLPSTRHRSNDSSQAADSTSSVSRLSEVRRGTRRSRSETPNGSLLRELPEEMDYSDMTTEIGQASNEDVTHDFELAKFPSLTDEDWQKTSVEHMQVTSLSSRIGSNDRSTAWNRRGAALGFNSNVGPESEMIIAGAPIGMPEGSWFAHAPSEKQKQRFPSLNDSFENAVPFVGKHSVINERFENRGRNDRGERLSRSRSESSGRESNLFDDDDQSDLNTEAFQRLAMETDDDSIFNGLVERTPSTRRQRDGPATQVDSARFEARSTKAGGDDNSVVSEEYSAGRSKYTSYTEAEQSKYTSYTEAEQSKYTSYTGDQSKYSKYSRGDFSKYSGRSMVSGGDGTVIYKEALEDPYTCMDRWLDN